ncbi:MAG: hypothetical protein WA087_04130 [Candidatus Saccharimonadales bacterium]
MEKSKSSSPKYYSLEDYNNLSQDDKDAIEKNVGDPHFNIDEIYRRNEARLARLADTSEAVATVDGPSVNLAQRALLLTDALRLDLKSSRLDGFTNKLDSKFDDQLEVDTVFHNNKQYDLSDVLRINKGSGRYRRQGDEKFHQAFGSSEMIEAGYDAKLVKDMAQKDANDFYDKYTGPAHQKDRNKYKTVLRKQQ